MKTARQRTPAEPNRRYSFSILWRARGSIETILSHRGDGEGGRRAEREGGGAQGPAAVDIAQVMGAEVDARKTDHQGDDDSGADDRGGAADPGTEPDHEHHHQPDIEGRVGSMPAWERGAGDVHQRPLRPRPV